MNSHSHRFRIAAFLILPALLGSPVLAAPTVPMERNFAIPPNGARPWVYYYVMDGHLTKHGITADLESMKAAGIGGFIFLEVNIGIPRGPIDFMSPEWLKLWAHTVHEAERLGLEVTMNAGPGWCGAGGPWIKAENAMQNVVFSNLDVSGPRNFKGQVPRPARNTNNTDFYRDIKVLAYPKPEGVTRITSFNRKNFRERGSLNAGETDFSDTLPMLSKFRSLPDTEVVGVSKVIDLTDKLGPNGELNWQVPAGEWTIVRLGAANNGHLSRPAPDAGVGLESDKFSKAGIEAQYNSYIKPLMKAVGQRKVTPDSGWNMLHIDSWEVGTQNYTASFLSEFQKRRGYDATSYLPALSGVVVGSDEQSNRFLWDWRQTCQELVNEYHVAHLRELGRKDGFGLSIEGYDKIMSSDISMGSVADVPTGEFWLYGGLSMDASLGEAASEAHTTGKKIVGAESFTSVDMEAWLGHPGSMKALGDYALTEGINRFVIHRYQQQPTLTHFPGMTMGPYGVHWERTQTWWDMVPAYHSYLSRSQYMLRLGLPVSDICYMVPEGAPYVFRAPIGESRNGQNQQPGYRFDAIAPEVLMARMTVKNGDLVLPDGTSYRVLVLPERDTMTPELLQKLSDLVRAGATVVGPRPVKSPSLSNFPASDAKVQQLSAALWGNCDGDKVPQHSYGKGRVIWKKLGTEIGQSSLQPFEKAKWIWFNEGDPASAVPLEKRAFKRVFNIDDFAQLKTATLSMTADNRFEASLNGQFAAQGYDWRQVWTSDIKKKLKAGSNTLVVVADNRNDNNYVTGDNPAGLIGNLRLTYADGRVVNVSTDGSWQSSKVNWQNSDAKWSPARVIGEFDLKPWSLETRGILTEYTDYSNLENVFQEMKFPEDFQSSGPIRFIHRRNGTAEIYFITNTSNKAVTANNSFRAGSKIPELWNPLTGERRALTKYSVKGNVITIPMEFAPLQSWFVIFKPGKQSGKGNANFPTLRQTQQLTGAWQVAFDPQWGGPKKTTFAALTDWSKHPDPGIKYYSGKAVYSKSFMAPASKTPLYLDLGKVNDLAEVRLNGRKVGVVWCAPWRVNLTGKVKPGVNKLEITVANLWPNRLIGDSALPESHRFSRTTWNPYTPKSPLLPSGLMGPVTLLQESSPTIQ